MKLSTVNKLITLYPYFLTILCGLTLYILCLYVGFSISESSKDVMILMVASIFIWLLFSPLLIVFLVILYPITFPFYRLLFILKEKGEDSQEEFNSKKYTIEILRNLTVKILRISALSTILYIPCLAFIFAINSETELELNHFLASSILTIPALFISLIIYSVLKWLKNATIIKSAEISLVVEILLYVSCAMLMIYMNPGKRIDYSLLSSSALLWAMIQPVVFLIYFVFKALRRPIPEEKPSALEAKEK